MLYLFEAFSWWWLGSFGKMLHHLSRILPWCQQHSSIPLDFCWHQLHFLPIWCSIMTSRHAFTVSIIFVLGCFDTASPARTNTGADFVCLPTHGPSLIYLHIEPSLCRQTKIDAIYVSSAIMTAIGRCTDFRDSTLPALTNGQDSEILHCRRWQMPRFPKYSIAGFLQNRVIWEFSIADFSQNEDFWETTLPVSLIIYTVWAESENLHYKPTMPISWNQQFCVKSTDFHVGKDRR